MEHIFYKTGVDISNDKSMFNFIKNHFKYDTMNSWNGVKSIANNVKLYKLNLEGDMWNALGFLQDDDYYNINSIIEEWEYEHKGYKVCFNGRSDGYLVLYNENNNRNILPSHIDENDYEGYKQWCKDYQGGVKYNRYELVKLTTLIRDFDLLCDNLRSEVNELSKNDFEGYKLETLINNFNLDYAGDLIKEGLSLLKFENRQVDTKEIESASNDFFIEELKDRVKRLEHEFGFNLNFDDGTLKFN